MVNRSMQAWVVLALVAAVPAAGAVVSEPGWSVSAMSTPGLSGPTTMQFLAADDFFVLEKGTGIVKRFQAGVGSPVLDLPVNASSERGLLGIELHPQFPATPWVYLYYSRADAGDATTWTENRLSRFTWNGASLVNETPLLAFERDPTQANGPNHDGGVLRFGPDGMLYGTTGDLNRNRAEQNNQATPAASSDVGGIFRIRPDGTLPDGSQPGETANPFLAEANAAFHRWFAYGVRNSFGAAFDPVTDVLWDTENGPVDYDEINRVAPGFNSGWDAIMGPESRSGNAPGDLVMFDSAAYSDPEFSWKDTIGVTAIEFLHGSALGPAYDDAVLVADVNLDQLYLFRLNPSRDGFVLGGDLADRVADDNTEAAPLVVGTAFNGPTDLHVGPDGAVYVVSLGDGAVYRIVPAPASAALLTLGAPAALRRGRRGRGAVPRSPLLSEPGADRAHGVN